MKTIALLVTLIASTAIADAGGTRCRTSTSGSVTYTTCEGGGTKTECRSSRSGSTVYTSCR
jgi:hypothetical protein